MKIVVAHPLFRPFESMFRGELEPEHEVVFATPAECDTPGAFDDADVLAAAGFPSRWSGRFPALKLMHAVGAGIDKFAIEALPKGARLCRTFGHGASIAEYVVMAMIALQRGLLRADRELREGRWRCPQYDPTTRMPPTLGGLTAVILGTGEIGVSVARACSALSMRCVGLNRSGRPVGNGAFARCVPITALDETLPDADFLIVAIPLEPDTQNLIDARRLGLLRPDAFLINVGRGPVVDEDALFDALEQRSIAGAALDVWYAYPRPGSNERSPAHRDFGALENVIMTPHISGVTRATFEHRARDILQNILALQSGAPLRNEIPLNRNGANTARTT